MAKAGQVMKVEKVARSMGAGRRSYTSHTQAQGVW